MFDPKNIKWKDFLTSGIPFPVPWGQDEIESLSDGYFYDISSNIFMLFIFKGNLEICLFGLLMHTKD